MALIAAIYARKSTEQNGVSDEDKSVARQVHHAKAYAAKKGWHVAGDHLYVDDGISGAQFVKRPGFLRLMNALKPTPPFQVLVMSEESRLGRESIETVYAFKQIMDAGVKVFFYLEDRERTLDTAMDKVMFSLSNFASEMEREKARQRTYDAMLRKAKALHVTGGRAFGYDNVEVFEHSAATQGEPRRLHVLRRINPDEARVVQHIFTLYASGLGLTRIAKRLNAERIAPPRHARGWAPSAIREMLYRPLYRGEVLWNQYQKVMRGGTKKRRLRPESEWLRIQAPELQIIPSDLWEAVQTRLAQAKQAFARQVSTQLVGERAAHRDFDSPYLLSGLARCKTCRGSLVAIPRTIKKERQLLYGCLYYQKRGPSSCPNRVVIRQEILDRVVLDAIAKALDERIVARAVELALDVLRSGHESRVDRRAATERELSLVEAREQHLAEVIARGEPPEPLLVLLRNEESRKKILLSELQSLAGAKMIPKLDHARLRQELRMHTADVRNLLMNHGPQARQILRKLLVGRLDCEAIEEGERRGYRVTGQGSYSNLLPGNLIPTQVVSPTGFEPVLPA